VNAIADGLFWAGYPNQIVYLEKITASTLLRHLPPIYDPDLNYSSTQLVQLSFSAKEAPFIPGRAT
jgi:hypothetical protein